MKLAHEDIKIVKNKFQNQLCPEEYFELRLMS